MDPSAAPGLRPIDDGRQSGQAQAAPQEGIAPSGNHFLLLFPELREAPGPAWLREGDRVTYYTQNATVNLDPDEDGASGAGYLQYDLVALDDRIALSSLKYYLDVGNGNLTPSFVLAANGIPGAGDYWLSPKVLKKAERVADDQLLVARMPLEVAGRTFQAVRFEYHADQAMYVWMFDEASGLLLFYRHAIGADGAPHQQLADMRLAGFRQLQIPWQAGAAPDWSRAGSRMRYEGTWSAGITGSTEYPLGFAALSEVTAAGRRWSQARVSSELAGQLQGSSERVTGSAQIFDGYWLPSQALAAAEDGKILDQDPVTGATIRVSRDNAGRLTLEESGQAYRTSLTYDTADGALIAVEQSWQTGIATNRVHLDLVSRD